MSDIPFLCTQPGGSNLPGLQVSPTTLTQHWVNTVVTRAAGLWGVIQVPFPGLIHSTICPFLPMSQKFCKYSAC